MLLLLLPLLLEIAQTQTRTHGADTCAREEAEAEADDAHVVDLFDCPEPLQLAAQVSNPPGDSTSVLLTLDELAGSDKTAASASLESYCVLAT